MPPNNTRKQAFTDWFCGAVWSHCCQNSRVLTSHSIGKLAAACPSKLYRKTAHFVGFRFMVQLRESSDLELHRNYLKPFMLNESLSPDLAEARMDKLLGHKSVLSLVTIWYTLCK